MTTTKTIPPTIQDELDAYRVAFVQKRLPDSMWESMHDYIAFGKEPCRFLAAVLHNDLANAVAFADDTNKTMLHVWVSYLFNTIPTDAWGSKRAVAEWCDTHGLKGRWGS